MNKRDFEEMDWCELNTYLKLFEQKKKTNVHKINERR